MQHQSTDPAAPLAGRLRPVLYARRPGVPLTPPPPLRPGTAPAHRAKPARGIGSVAVLGCAAVTVAMVWFGLHDAHGAGDGLVNLVAYGVAGLILGAALFDSPSS